MRPRQRWMAIAVVAALLVLGVAWRALPARSPAASPTPELRGGATTPGATVPAAVASDAPASTTALARAAPAAPPRPGAPAVANGGAPAAPRAPRAVDAAWRDVTVAFGLRELGRAGPYVKTGLDAARADMEFCFQGRDGQRDPSPRASQPAVLTLYLEARDGAIDVVETVLDHEGTQGRAVVDCCRDVLRGYEMPAFGVVPGQRYRLKYQLD